MALVHGIPGSSWHAAYCAATAPGSIMVNLSIPFEGLSETMVKMLDLSEKELLFSCLRPRSSCTHPKTATYGMKWNG